MPDCREIEIYTANQMRFTLTPDETKTTATLTGIDKRMFPAKPEYGHAANGKIFSEETLEGVDLEALYWQACTHAKQLSRSGVTHTYPSAEQLGFTAPK